MAKEQILVRMGLDQQPLVNGLKGSTAYVQQFTSKVTKEFAQMGKNVASHVTSLLRANVYMAAADLISRLIPTAQEFWDNIYGLTPELEAKFERTRQHFSKLREELQKLNMSLETKWWNRMFGSETDEGKLKMLDDKMKSLTDQMKKQRDIVLETEARARRPFNLFGPETDMRMRQENITKMAEAKVKLLKLEEEHLALTEKRDDVEEKMLKRQEEIAAALDWSDLATAKTEWDPSAFTTATPPEWSVHRQMRERQEALRRAMVERFGDPSLNTYRLKLEAESEQKEVNQSLLTLITPQGLKVTPGD